MNMFDELKMLLNNDEGGYFEFIKRNDVEIVTRLFDVNSKDVITIDTNMTFLKTHNILFHHDMSSAMCASIETNKKINELIDHRIKHLKIEQEKLNLKEEKK